ncbi:hypothetical protein GOBAR_DD28323 [Gossypium barbadense]|nr:hypothetical protein GOBAR_DD28323 [Gossypium barbadense]
MVVGYWAWHINGIMVACVACSCFCVLGSSQVLDRAASYISVGSTWSDGLALNVRRSGEGGISGVEYPLSSESIGLTKDGMTLNGVVIIDVNDWRCQKVVAPMVDNGRWFLNDSITGSNHGGGVVSVSIDEHSYEGVFFGLGESTAKEVVLRGRGSCGVYVQRRVCDLRNGDVGWFWKVRQLCVRVVGAVE